MAEGVLEVLPKRLGKYGLRLHPDKTRMVAFGRPSRDLKQRPRGGGPTSYDFLGFTHYWGRSRKGNWVVKQKTARKRYMRCLLRIRDWLRRHRHRPVQEQHAALCLKIQGHFAYFGVLGNTRWLDRFSYEVRRAWRKWLNRRTRGAPKYTWDVMTQFLRQFPLPPVRLHHAALRQNRETEEPYALCGEPSYVAKFL